MTTRARRLKYIHDSGPRTLLTLLSEMIRVHGEDWLTDSQIEDMTRTHVANRKFLHVSKMRNRRHRAANERG